ALQNTRELAERLPSDFSSGLLSRKKQLKDALDKLSPALSMPKGKLLFQFGSKGSNDGQFGGLYGIAADEHRIYVCDYRNHRIQVFDSFGKFLFKFGSQGSGDSQFDYPKGIVVDSEKRIIVHDQERIQVFDSSGKFLFKFG